MRKLEQTATDPRTITVDQQVDADLERELELRATRERRVARLRLLWSQRSLLSGITVVGFVLATVAAFLIPNGYQSTAQLMPPDSESGSGLALVAALAGQSGSLGAMAGDLLGIKTTGALFIGVLRSRTVEDQIIERFDLNKEYGTRWDYKARQHLEANTEISEDRKSGIITLSVTDRDPRRAAGIAESFIDELNALMAQLNTSSAHRERVFLEERLSKVNQDLESSERDFGQFASKHGTIDISEQGKAMVEAAATMEGQLIAAQSELQGLKAIYTDDNIRVRSTQARINELRAQLQKLGGKVSDTLSTDSSEAVSDAPYPTIRQLPLLGVPYADKYRQLKVEETVYATLTKEYELAKVEEAKEIPSVKVLDPPEVPEHKSFPPRLLIIFAGTIGALILGALFGLGSARWHAADPQDPLKILTQEIAGTLRARARWLSRNGSGVDARAQKNSDRIGHG